MVDLHPDVRGELDRLVLRRLRVALLLGVAAAATFAVVNHWWWAQPPAWTDAMNALITVLALAALAATSIPFVARHATPFALLAFTVGSGLRVLAAVWHGEVAATALLLLALALITAATLPWGVLAQTIMAAIAAVAIAANAYLVDGTFGPPPGHAAATVVLGLVVSVLLAVELQRHRVQLLVDNLRRRQAEDRLARLNAELEQRVAERTAQLETATAEAAREARERERAAQELRASEERLQDILDHATAHIHLKDAAGRFRLVNRHWAETFGRSREEVIGKTVYDIFPAPVADVFHDSDQTVLATGRSLQFENTMPVRGVPTTYLTVKFPLFDATGTPLGVCGISTDITARKATEAELRRSEAALSALIDNTTDAIWAVDTAERITVMNAVARARFRERYGVDFDPAARADVEPALSEEFHDYYRRALAGEHVQIERSYDGPSGTRHFLTSVHPVLDNGVVTGATVFSKDVTERRAAEEEARRHQADLAHVLRLGTMGEMAAGLAHEINQPLGAIANYAQGCVRRLRAGTLDAVGLLPVIEAIGHEALRAGEIIRRLRDLVRKETVEQASVDLNRVVQESARFVEAEASECGIAIALDLAPQLPTIPCNAIQIEQVLLNLLRNGVDALQGSANGDRRLAVRTAQTDADTIEITVRDSGVGLPPEPADVFAPFYSTKTKGLGMGLSISRSIIEAHGGRLWATRNPDRGSTFHITLPVSVDGEKTPDSPQRTQGDAEAAPRDT